MAKAKQGSSSAGRAKASRPAATKRPATRPAPKKAANKVLLRSAPAVKPPAKKAPPPKSAPVAGAKKAGAATATATAVKGAPKAMGGATAPATSNREKAPVKDGGKDGKATATVAAKNVKAGAKEAAPAAVKGKDGKAKESAKDAGKGVAKDAKGKPVKGKVPAAPPPPPRKIQVVQLSTLKPGARGSKTILARRSDDDGDKAQQNGAKKRRSAELTSQQLDHFRELLEQRRHRLSSDLTLMQDEALKVTGQDNSADSVADAGTDNYEQDFTLGLIESEEALAREVDEALIRLEQAAFGVCESCETPIPLARLEILPFTRYCVDCQQKREGQG